MKNPTAPQKNNILCPEEIAFFLRPREQRGTNAVLATACYKKACFSGREEQIAAAFARELKTFLRTPPTIRTTPAPLTPVLSLSEETLCFRLEVPGQETFCLLNGESAGALVATALATPYTGHGKMKGLSLAIVKKYMETLTTAVCCALSFPRSDKSCRLLPTTAFNKTNFVSFGIQLDICNREAKLCLCFKVPDVDPKTPQKTFFPRRPNDARIQSLPDGKITLVLRTPPQLHPLREILNWRTGTFFPLGIKASDPAELATRGLKPLKVSVGRKGSRIVAKLITKVIENDTN